MPFKNTLTAILRHLAALATSLLLTATLLACTSDTEQPPKNEQISATDAKTQSAKKQWSKDKDEWKSLPDGTTLERTARLAEDAGGEVHYIDHPGRGDRTVLVLPLSSSSTAGLRSSSPFTATEPTPPSTACTCLSTSA